jgi:uncharacterized Zn finger protein
MSWFPPYVPVAERRRRALAAARRIAKKQARSLAPIVLSTKHIATTFWGRAWCANLEAYSDYANRLPRGRTYVRNGSVIDLQVTTNKVEALVAGSELYAVAIKFKALSPRRWKKFKADSAGKVTNLIDLLQGRLSSEILQDITAQGTGLFPAPAEISLACSCPDWAEMCKHVAAVLYGVGARLDAAPELFFTLRGVELAELFSAASAQATAPIAETLDLATGLDDSALSELFGVEIDAGTPSSRGALPKPATATKSAIKSKPKVTRNEVQTSRKPRKT